MQNKAIILITFIILLATLYSGCRVNYDNELINQSQISRGDGISTPVPYEASSSANNMNNIISDGVLSNNTDKTPNRENETKLQMKINDNIYVLNLYENDSCQDFISRLPITIEMAELNGNEKYFYFDEGFPVHSEKLDNIHAGDLMLYGSDCLVLFYQDFSTSYNYTKLGFIEEPTKLAEDLGEGSIQVSFFLDN